jgi:hypothetical protein
MSDTKPDCACYWCNALAAAIERHTASVAHHEQTKRQVQRAARAVDAAHGLTEPAGGTQWRARR